MIRVVTLQKETNQFIHGRFLLVYIYLQKGCGLKSTKQVECAFTSIHRQSLIQSCKMKVLCALAFLVVLTTTSYSKRLDFVRDQGLKWTGVKGIYIFLLSDITAYPFLFLLILNHLKSQT